MVYVGERSSQPLRRGSRGCGGKRRAQSDGNSRCLATNEQGKEVLHPHVGSGGHEGEEPEFCVWQPPPELLSEHSNRMGQLVGLGTVGDRYRPFRRGMTTPCRSTVMWGAPLWDTRCC